MYDSLERKGEQANSRLDSSRHLYKRQSLEMLARCSVGIIASLVMLALLGSTPPAHSKKKHPTSSTLSFMTHNTQNVGDTFSSGWGCMAEIARRDALVASANITLAAAEAQLLSARFQRMARYLEETMRSGGHAAIALQVWGGVTCGEAQLQSAYLQVPVP